MPLGDGDAASGSGNGAATLRDLCPEDKAKVARLIRQVVELGSENERLRAGGAGSVAGALEGGAAEAAESEGVGGRGGANGGGGDRLRHLQEANRQVIAHNVA